jgi:lysyl-tRNA synthetase class I
MSKVDSLVSDLCEEIDHYKNKAEYWENKALYWRNLYNEKLNADLEHSQVMMSHLLDASLKLAKSDNLL